MQAELKTTLIVSIAHLCRIQELAYAAIIVFDRATNGIKSRTTECRDNPAIINQEVLVHTLEAVCLRLPYKEALRKEKQTILDDKLPAQTVLM